jgi:glycosyltransferase involved in cell wall biosynthesis
MYSMHSNYSISVTLPAYNEEENIAPMVSDVVEVMAGLVKDGQIEDYEVIVVNDGSRDDTAQVVRDLSLRSPAVRLVDHEVNQGYGAAVYTGFTSARKDLIFLTDSDKQFEVSEIALLLPLLDEADLVAGYRAPRRDPFKRRLFGTGWTTLVTVLFGYTVRDVDCAFKLFRREIVDSIDIESRGATFSAEFLVRAKRKGYRFREAPVTHLPRVAGSQTGANVHVITRAFRELIRFRLKLWRE